MSLYTHGYEVIQRPTMSWTQVLGWARKIERTRSVAMVLNVGLWALVIHSVAGLIG